SDMKAAILPLAAVVLLSACATVPTGPSVMVLPGTGKNFDQFQGDTATCRQFAEQQIGAPPAQPVVGSTVTGAAVGTALGAALGAAIGAAAGNPAMGAAIGAGSGLFGGTVVGANADYGTGVSLQRRYDMAFMQCMYTRGNQIPVARRYQNGPRAWAPPPPPPPPQNTPLPPPGPPPPPPPPPR